MKSALIRRSDDGSCAAQRRRSSGNTSREREGQDEIGSCRRTDPERVRSNRVSGAGAFKIRQKRDQTVWRFTVVARTDCSFCQISITPDSGMRTDTSLVEFRILWRRDRGRVSEGSGCGDRIRIYASRASKSEIATLFIGCKPSMLLRIPLAR